MVVKWETSRGSIVSGTSPQFYGVKESFIVVEIGMSMSDRLSSLTWFESPMVRRQCQEKLLKQRQNHKETGRQRIVDHQTLWTLILQLYRISHLDAPERRDVKSIRIVGV